MGVWHALKEMAPRANLKLAVADDMTGVPIPASALTDTAQRSRGDARRSTMRISTSRAAQAVRCRPAVAAAGPAHSSSPVAGDYDIDLQLLGATGNFGIDGKLIGRMAWWGGHGDIVFANRDNVVPTTDGLDNLRRLVHLDAGAHAITVEVDADGSGDEVQARLAWVTPEMKQRAFADAIEAARTSKMAVVFAWSRNRPAFGSAGRAGPSLHRGSRRG